MENEKINQNPKIKLLHLSNFLLLINYFLSKIKAQTPVKGVRYTVGFGKLSLNQ